MNILIADDEPLIHISIEKLLSRCRPDLNIVHAYSGREMLKWLEDLDISLAYVDIKMPGISGLEAIRQGRERSPHTRYYIMTGFDEFEYAKQAIRLKVDDYLMKPLDLPTVKETLEAALKIGEQQEAQKKDVFRNWLESALNGRQGSLGAYSGYFWGLILVCLDCPMPSGEVLGPLSGHEQNMVSVLWENRLFLMVFSEKGEQVHNALAELSRASYPRGVACFGAPALSGPKELPILLPKLERVSCLRVLLGYGRFYWLTPLLSSPSWQLSFCQACVSWQSAWQKKDYAGCLTASALICSQYARLSLPPKARQAMEEFFQLTAGLKLPENPRDLEAAFNQAKNALLAAPEPDGRAEAIVRFIQEHYREDISAAELAGRFGLSPSYISSLLKQTLGIRYSEYVTQLRLGYAKKLLLSTRKSIKEITADCGYYSQSHFTKLFLEKEGCTPLEYRKARMGQDREGQ